MRRNLERSEVIFLLMMVSWYTALALYTTDDLTYFTYFLPFWILPMVMWYAKRRPSRSGEDQDDGSDNDQPPSTSPPQA